MNNGKAELYFRCSSEPSMTVWVCDLGILSEVRLKGGPEDDLVAGSPDIVIKVRFEGGCKQFRAVDPKLRSVRV